MKRSLLLFLIAQICSMGFLMAASDPIAAAKETSLSSPEFWYNRGLSEEKSGDSASASLSFRRALLLDPTLKPARKELSKVLGILGIPLSLDWRDQVWTRIHPDVLILGGAILGWIGVFLLVIFLLVRHGNPIFKKPLFIALALTAIILGHGLSIVGSMIDPRRMADHFAVVTAKNTTTLRATPADSATASGTIAPGSLMTILSRNDLWWYVSDGSGHTGWILSNTITPLLPASTGF